MQALFEHGWLVAAHTSVRIGAGTGGSAAARLSVDHPAALDYATRVGAHLRWHGGLTLDYFHVDGQPEFIECTPRTVEPGNAAHAGVDLPRLTIALSRGRTLPDRPAVGRPGVRTRGALALAIGAAEQQQRRATMLVPASTTPHQLRTCLGAWVAKGRLTFSLNCCSAATFAL
ncbi:hypothetical protein [Streptomyces sp. YIM S03343]